MFDVLLSSIKFLRRPGGLARTPSVIAGRQVPEWTRDPPDFKNFAENFRHRSGRNPVRSSWLILRRKAAMPARPALAKVVEDIMNVHRTLAAALIAGSVSALAGSAQAVPLSASLSLRDASTSDVQPVQWRRGWGWGGIGFGLAAGAIVGAALAAPYYRYGYGGYGYGGYGYGGCYGCGYPAYAYGGYYPSYRYAYTPYYSYAYAPAYYSYGYASPYYAYASYPRVRYRAAYRSLRRW
jgi:hypothetical protein